MGGLIRLLPDHLANQIAAGEVVQRPASAVKELLENALDAGATHITLVVKDGGKTLIQVIDNGSGMDPFDARMAFERHATSKLHTTEDLFNIRTKGFRGEALASIAAVAQVEMKTRRAEDVLGQHLLIEGNQVATQTECQCPVGTQIAIKNLFFNIPARRKFLKAESVEFRHILDEFHRVALAHPEVAFDLYHNGSITVSLTTGNLRQRIVGIFGKGYNERLVPLEEETPIVKLSGFVAKPEWSRKTRGEQFFFVNNRFIKSNYLHQAVASAFEGLISAGEHPAYFILLQVDPHSIDINIHPAKTEVKFEEEQVIYATLKSAVRHALGQFNIAPSLDFESEQHLFAPPDPHRIPTAPSIRVNPHFNPFVSTRAEPTSAEDWNQLLATLSPGAEEIQSSMNLPAETSATVAQVLGVIDGKFMLATIEGHFVVVHTHRARERIVYEHALHQLQQHSTLSQQLLFPLTVALPRTDFALVEEALPTLREMGFDLDPFSDTEWVINGVPFGLDANRVNEILDEMVDSMRNLRSGLKSATAEEWAKMLAKSAALRMESPRHTSAQNALLLDLLACEMPAVNPQGKPILVSLSSDDLEKRFA
jgi:DNA mismatch repair protein MutL